MWTQESPRWLIQESTAIPTARMSSDDEKKREGRMPGLEELEGHHYTIGVPGQKERYMKTTRALEDFLGRNVDKTLRMLV